MKLKPMTWLIIAIALLCIGFALLLVFVSPANSQEVPLKNGWGVGLVTSIPVFKIVESTDPAAKMDAVAVVGIGGGPCLYYTNDKTAAEIRRIVTWAPLVVILSARIDGEDSLDPLLGTMVGLLDDRVQFGVGYNAGKLEEDRSRWEILMSLGVQFK